MNVLIEMQNIHIKVTEIPFSWNMKTEIISYMHGAEKQRNNFHACELLYHKKKSNRVASYMDICVLLFTFHLAFHIRSYIAIVWAPV